MGELIRIYSNKGSGWPSSMTVHTGCPRGGCMVECDLCFACCLCVCCRLSLTCAFLPC